MASATMFAVPGMYLRPESAQETTARKRKRSNGKIHLNPHDETAGTGNITLSSSAQLAEYTAVVTPQERAQRRLAGQTPNEPPPASPFPHAAYHSSHTSPTTSNNTHAGVRLKVPSGTYLHNQHLAVMSAILHRSLMDRDYGRASRAFGLILRNDIGGRPIDIRAAGLWGVGAEILLRYQQDATEGMLAGEPLASRVSREGYERVRTYYESLVVQFPQQKTWPGAVNAKDFYIAMFSLWVFVIHQEIIRLKDRQTVEDDDDLPNQYSMLLDNKLWELEQARSIGESMDMRMRDISYRDDVELIRLRAMVALWEGDLLEQCSGLEEDENIRIEHEEELQDMEDLADNVERIALTSAQPSGRSKSRTEEAVAVRKLAQSLFEQLRSK